ncbi:unnamed protein product [Porites lobata]|uniref:Uncharacterized protein n=1 Tax=Porites lobata TaxID=104759 RepID=A0ABN8P9Z8_9CNID|nr:unnamed protein product [Porites lobata]
MTRQSPYIDVCHGHHIVRVTIDSVATRNMIRHSTAKHLGCPIMSSAQSVQQADGSSQLQREVLLGNGSTYTYGSQAPPSPPTTVRRAFVLHAPTPSKTLWPGEFLEVQLPDDAPPDSEYGLEPRTDAPSLHNLKPSQLWPEPGIISSVLRAIRIPNLSPEPRTLKRHEHFCQVTPVFEPKDESPTSQSPTQRPLPPSHASHSTSIQSFKVILADPLHAPCPCRGHDSNDGDDPDTTPPHPRCLTSLMLSLLQPSICLTFLAVLHHLLLPFLSTASWTTKLPSHLALRTLLWRRQSFQ